MLNQHSLQNKLILVEVRIPSSETRTVVFSFQREHHFLTHAVHLLQEYPNVFFTRTTQFHDILRFVLAISGPFSFFFLGETISAHFV